MFVFLVTSDDGPGGDNLTLTCLLTCAVTKCEEDFNLTWVGSSHSGWQRSLIVANKTLASKLFLSGLQTRPETLACAVSREGVVMAAKKWSSVNSTYAILSL